MSIGKNTRFACVAFGLVALFAAAQAVPKAVIYWRYVDQAFWVDALRFGCIGFTMALGLAMLLPHRSLPWVVRQAESPGGGGFWIGAGVAFLPIVGTWGFPAGHG